MIVGVKGNIGRYYAGILKRLGQQVDGVDIEFIPKAYKRKHDSVLICTPPETHADIIGRLPNGMPIFCEKPLIVDPNGFFSWCVENQHTLVSANWIFCDHIAGLAKKDNFSLRIGYPNKSQYWYWDLIHFWSWYVHTIGEPQIIHVSKDKARAFLHMYSDKGGKTMDITIEKCKDKFTFFNYNGGPTNEIHKAFRSCNMHRRQLRHWINVLRGKEKSVNPLDVSLEHHRELGILLEANNAVH